MNTTSIGTTTVAFALCLLATPAQATPPTDIETTTQIIDVDEDGVVLTVFEGDIEGYSLSYLGPGAATTVVCYCTVLGMGGDAPIYLLLAEPRHGETWGSWTVKSASGELAGMRGHGKTWYDPDTYAGEAWGKVHFEPDKS